MQGKDLQICHVIEIPLAVYFCFIMPLLYLILLNFVCLSYLFTGLFALLSASFYGGALL